MRLDLGWDRPARRYAHVYRALSAPAPAAAPPAEAAAASAADPADAPN